VCFSFGVVVCSEISLFSLLSRFLYLIYIIFFSFSSMLDVRLCVVPLYHVLARDKCKWHN
jgi:hypothetical protein